MSDNDYGRADPLANIRIRLAKVSDRLDKLVEGVSAEMEEAVEGMVDKRLRNGQIRKLILRDYADESGQLLGMTRDEIKNTAAKAIEGGRHDRWVMSKASLLVRRAAGTHDIYNQEEHEARRELVAMVKRVAAEMALLDRSDLASINEDMDGLRATIRALQNRLGPPEPETQMLQPGMFIRLPDSAPDWWEMVVGFGPDGRMITVDRENRVQRYSDPTERWLVRTEDMEPWNEPRGFTGAKP